MAPIQFHAYERDHLVGGFAGAAAAADDDDDDAILFEAGRVMTKKPDFHFPSCHYNDTVIATNNQVCIVRIKGLLGTI